MITTVEWLAARREGIPGPLVATSGGFDPLHVGHLRCLVAARAMGAALVVIVNSDRWLRRKKGYVFMPQAERMEILDALRCVNYVVSYDDHSDTVSGALLSLRPEVFAKGISLARPQDLPEWDACRSIGCRVALDVGGPKVRSSQDLVNGVPGPAQES